MKEISPFVPPLLVPVDICAALSHYVSRVVSLSGVMRVIVWQSVLQDRNVAFTCRWTGRREGDERIVNQLLINLGPDHLKILWETTTKVLLHAGDRATSCPVSFSGCLCLLPLSPTPQSIGCVSVGVG